ncbi:MULTISPECIES: hypothetical protein [unclassified Isoptericola]|uniref:hypothetical protein n=1 Tax=unclassified Isoptericola TaxID=2623355 RepID=UPI0027144664|nr:MULTISPECIES: hypothetical protein [unclassified Isoptericola]MDO8144917.1 hypothetical protein [Isoptericola sp. 178]MDO8149696.1 hypothetical protein [Isoptericola sp. b515]MDO8152631.1 hypothetical protein [Isoptericola sp. b408]
MVSISVVERVSVADGPSWTLDVDLEPDAYVVSEATLARHGQAGDRVEVTLVPAGVSVTLLAVSAVDETGRPAVVRVTPRGDVDGAPLAVHGALLLANADVVGGLVPVGGPVQVLDLVNDGTAAISVRVLAAFDELDG